MLWAIYIPHNSYAEALTSSVALFRDGASKEGTKVQCGHKDRGTIQ